MARRPSTEPPRAWQRMLSGRRLDLLDPSPLDIEIEDIAHGLARVARWNGQTHGINSFSVAQHSLVVEEIARHLEIDLPAPTLLAILLHDAAEYVIGDMISPFKAVLGESYKSTESRLMNAVHVRFALPPKPAAGIIALTKRADRICAFHEATRLAGFEVTEAEKLFGKKIQLPARILALLEPWATQVAQERYLTRFKELTG